MSWQDRTEPKNCISDLWRGRGKEDSTFFLQWWIEDSIVQCRMYPYLPWGVFTCDANKVDRQPTSACANCVYAIGESVLAVSMLAE